MKKYLKYFTCFFFVLTLKSIVLCQTIIATDTATNSVYNGAGNFNGLNGGSGFTAWIVNPSSNTGNSGAFMGNSSDNGGSPNIGQVTWALYSNSENQIYAQRNFSTISNSGDSVSFLFDNDCISTGSGSGSFAAVQLFSVDGNLAFEFRIDGDTTLCGGSSNSYNVNNGSSFQAIQTIPFTVNGISVTVTLTSNFGTNSGYQCQVEELNNATTVTVSALFNSVVTGIGINQIRFIYNGVGGGGTATNVYFNNITVSIPYVTTQQQTTQQQTTQQQTTQQQTTQQQTTQQPVMTTVQQQTTVQQTTQQQTTQTTQQQTTQQQTTQQQTTRQQTTQQQTTQQPVMTTVQQTTVQQQTTQTLQTTGEQMTETQQTTEQGSSQQTTGQQGSGQQTTASNHVSQGVILQISSVIIVVFVLLFI